MRISFDMQALQAANSIGGIGRYNRDFLKTLFRLYPNNHYTLYYNGGYTDRPLDMNEFTNAEPRTVRYFPGNDLNPFNAWIQLASYYSRRADLIHILSPFEDHRLAVISHRHLPAKVVTTIYDFIPYIFHELYLSGVGAKQLYFERLKIVESSDLILSISEATRQDAIRLFNVKPEKIRTIGLAPSGDYYRVEDSDLIEGVKRKHGIEGDYVLTVSNLDHRKNLTTLLQAFSSLPDDALDEFSLVVISNTPAQYIQSNEAISGLLRQNQKARIKFLYFISNDDLRALYNSCSLFIYASLYEGGGLPVLEAMRCGAPVIASNTSSIPEYLGRQDTLFDPREPDEIARCMLNLLTNAAFREVVRNHGLEFSSQFTWQRLVEKAMAAYEELLSS